MSEPSAQQAAPAAAHSAVDITDDLRSQGHLTGEDWNAEDRIYRLGERVLKVKTFHDLAASRLGHEVLRISVSDADETGKARRRPDGAPAILVQGFPVTIASFSEVDLGAVLEQARQGAVEIADRAARQAEGLARAAGVAATTALPPLMRTPQ